MKRYNKINIILALVLSSLLSSCTEDIMDRINDNENNPKDANARNIVTDLIVNTSFSTVGGEFSLYSSIYIEHEAGIDNQMLNAETRVGEPTSGSTYNNMWESSYFNIKNAKLVIKKCSPGGSEEGNNITLGIGKVFLAYNAAVLTDLFGDIPYFQAGELKDNSLPLYPQPKVDKQEDVYKDIMKQLDEAITLFDGEDGSVVGAVGANDLIYNGSGAAWKKVAYGLKARYTMRLLARSQDKIQSLNAALQYISQSFESSEEEFKFDAYNGTSQINPLGAFSLSRYALGASRSLVNKFKERNDPRGVQLFINADTEDLRTDMDSIFSVTNGAPSQQTPYDWAAIDFSVKAPTQLLSYHELQFLKAEAYARLGNTIAAESALKEAMYTAFDNLRVALRGVNGLPFTPNLSRSVVDNYYNNNVKPLFDADPLKEVMNQKYLAMMGASGESIEAYNDYRRMQGLGENFITLENPKNVNKFPLRFVYGSSDVSANMNVKPLVGDGTYVYTEKVWWAGGTR